MIRPYGPGKFDTLLDSFIYETTMDGGADDEVSYEDAGGWSGMLYGKDLLRIVEENLPKVGDRLDQEEEELLHSIKDGGVILTESTDGFVYVTYHETKKKLLNAWDATKEDYE